MISMMTILTLMMRRVVIPSTEDAKDEGAKMILTMIPIMILYMMMGMTMVILLVSSLTQMPASPASS